MPAKRPAPLAHDINTARVACQVICHIGVSGAEDARPEFISSQVVLSDKRVALAHARLPGQ